MPASAANSHHRRKKDGFEIDDDDREDYSNEPLETSVVENDDDPNPFREESAVDAGPPTAVADPVSLTEAVAGDLHESEEQPRVPRTEVPIEDLLAPPKRKDEKISAGYEMVSSPQSRVYTIEESDPSLPDPATLGMSIISSGDESWEHLSNDGEDDDDDVSVLTDDRKQYADVVKTSAPSSTAGGTLKRRVPRPEDSPSPVPVVPEL